MTIRNQIVDGTGRRYTARVTSDHELLTTTIGVPPYGEKQSTLPLRQYLTREGTATGTFSMLVNGSSTNVEYWIGAHTVNDRYISVVQFVISDAGPSLYKFGAITALTNGCQLFYSSKYTGIQYFHTALKSNFDFMRLALGNPTISGSTPANTWLIGGAITTSTDSYIPTIGLNTLMPPYGLKLDAGSDQRLIFKIRDNCSTIDGFDCLVFGFERLPDETNL